MRTFYIKRDYYDPGRYIFRKAHIAVKPGLTVLIGCNGCGKTTFLEHVKQVLEKESITTVSFNNVSDGGSNSISRAGFYGDMEFMAKALCSSEGERIRLNIERIASMCGTAVRKLKKDPKAKQELWVLLDAVDSGFSIDNILELKKDLFEPMIADCREKGIELYILAAANEFEMARCEQCLDIQTGKYVSCNSYERYSSIIMRTRRWKDKFLSQSSENHP